MGLDVHLYRYDNYADTTRREKEYEQRSEAVWEQAGEYSSLTQQQKDAVRDELKGVAATLLLDEYGSDRVQAQKIEIPSAKYPEHYFKIGYWRSSYNDGGINRRLSQSIGEDLYSIAGQSHKDPEYHFQPDWAATRLRAANALTKFKARMEQFPFQCTFIDAQPMHSACTSAEDALKQFEKTLAEHKHRPAPFGDSFSNAAGDFFLEGWQVYGLLRGRQFNFQGDGHYVVYKMEQESIDFYTQALEIVIETCDYVLAQDDQSKFWLHWSG